MTSAAPVERDRDAAELAFAACADELRDLRRELRAAAALGPLRDCPLIRGRPPTP